MFHRAKINVHNAALHQTPSVTILIDSETALQVDLDAMESSNHISKNTVKRLVTFVSQIIFASQKNKAILMIKPKSISHYLKS